MKRPHPALAVVAFFGLAAPALADPQDFQLHRLGLPSAESNANFRSFANQLGVALASYNLEPPETLGHSAFNFGLEYAVARVDAKPSVWPRQCGASCPTDLLLMPTIQLRKGLPFSFELGSKIAYLQYSRMTAATVEVKWALNEGFFYLPDLGVRGHGTRLLGARDFGLITAGVDVGLGKQFAIGGMATLTPYAGWNLIYVNATSSVIDFRPERSLSDALERATENTGVFDQVKMSQKNDSNRFYGGLRYISLVFELTGEVSYTKTPDNRKIIVYGGKLGLDF